MDNTNTYSTNFAIKPDLDLLNSPEKELEVGTDKNSGEDALEGNASGDYMQCSSTSPSLRSDFCNQICRIFDESDNREQIDERLCTSSLLAPEQQNETDEEVTSSFINSIVNDLLCQRPAQLDVLVSGKKRQNEFSNGKRRGKECSNNELLRESATQSVRHGSAPPLLAEDVSSLIHPSNIGEIENQCQSEKSENSSTSELNGCRNDFVDVNISRNGQRQMSRRSGEIISERSAFDPVTKRTFYEPHKRIGCTGEYCLSQITQIGERICSMENKLTRLSELFHELVEENSETTALPQESQRVRTAPLPSQLRLGPNVSQFCAQPSAAPSINSNTSLFLNSTTIAHNNSDFLPTYQPKKHKDLMPFNSLSIPNKVLEYGLRIYFPENETMKECIASATACPICFAKVEPFADLNDHVLRHLDKKYMAEFFSCKLCKGPNSVHFLSVLAIREHIRSMHGVVADSYLLINIYPGNNTQKGTTRTMVQEVLKRFAMVRFEQWRNICQIKTKLASLKRSCIFPSAPCSKSQDRKKVAKKQKEEDADHIIFSSSKMPKNISERFHRLTRIDRISSDRLFVPICEKSFVGLSNTRIFKIMAYSSQKRE